MTPVSLGLLLAWMPSFSAQLNLGAQSDNEVGYASLVPGEAPRALVNLSVIPSASLGLGFGRTDVALSYSFRVLQRYELDPPDNGTDLGATLYFHAFSAEGRHRFQAGWSLSESASVNLGLADFGTIGLVGATDTAGSGARGGSTEAVWVLAADGNASLSGDLTRNWGFSVGGRVSQTGPINGSAEARETLIEFLLYSVNASLTWERSTRDRFSMGLEGSWSDSPDVGLFRTISGTLGYERNLSRNTTLNMQAGAAFIDQLTLPTNPTLGNTIDQGRQFTPVVSLQLSSRLFQVREAQIGLSFGGSVSAVPNLLRGGTEPMASLNMEWSVTLRPDWSVALQLGFNSPIGCDGSGLRCAPPRSDGLLSNETRPDPNPDPDMPDSLQQISAPCSNDAADYADGTVNRTDLTCQEAIWTLTLPVAYQPDPDFAIQFGVRVTVLGPRVRAPSAFDFTSVAGLGYFGLTFTSANQL